MKAYFIINLSIILMNLVKLCLNSGEFNGK